MPTPGGGAGIIKGMKKKAYGFTIVELLIVIVIIAILASITLVSYNGITKRANQAADASAIEQYVKIFALMRADDNLPTNWLCLGPSGKYTSAGTCSFVGQNGVVDSTWNNEIASYGMTNQPDLVGAGKGKATSMVGVSDSAKNKNTIIMYSPAYWGHKALIWAYNDGESCGQSNIMSLQSGVWGVYGAEYSTKESYGLKCYVALDV